MKNNKIALLLAMSMALCTFNACGGNESSTAQTKTESDSIITAESVTENDNDTDKNNSKNSNTSNSSQTDTESGTESSGQYVSTFNERAIGGTIKNNNANKNSSGTSASQQTASGNTSNNPSTEQTNYGNGTSGNTSSNNASSANQNNSSANVSANNSGTSQQSKVTSPASQSQQTIVTTVSENYDTEDAEPVTPAIQINISDSGCSASCDSSLVSINGSTVTINAGGKYAVSGTLSNGQIVVNAPKTEKVNLHLNGASITSQTSAAIYVLSADTCVLHVDEGSENYLADTSSNALKGCIISKDDFTIKGNGNLTIVGNKQFGIKSNNDIKIKNGNITVSSIKAAIYGEDSVKISGGNVVIASCKDGIKTSNVTDPEKGFVLIEDGSVDIRNASGNGIEAITYITISGGYVKVHSTKNSLKCDVQTIVPECFTEY